MKFFSTLAIFLASFISSILAGDCNNPLLSIFNIQSLGTPTEVTGLKYCKSLQSSQSCCSADTINGFQAKANELAEKLKVIVAARDRQIVETREQVIPQLKNSLQELKNNSQQALTVLKGKKQQPGNATNGGNQTQPQQPPQNGSTNGEPLPPPNGTNNTGPQGQLPPPNGTNNTGPQGQLPPPNGTNNTGPQGQLPPPNGTNNTNPQGQQPQQPEPIPINESSPGFSAASSLAESLGKLSEEVIDGLPKIKGNFTAFQKSRSTCVIEMVKMQAAAWCLSCDPNYASKGVSGSETVQLSNTVCGRLQGACYQFISQSSQQSAILSIKNLAPKIGKMSEGLQMIIADNSTGLSELTNSIEGVDNTTSGAAPPVGVPPNCTEGQCSWICTDLFRNGQVNETLVSAGGAISSIADDAEEEVTSRILLEEGTIVREKLMKKRVLQTSEWNPDQDEAGVTVTFVDDPASVNTETSSAGAIQASLMGLAALIATFMI